MQNTYHFISGLPRTGSTLLSAVLSQNPAIYAGGNSALCQLMWDTQQSCRNTSHQQLAATGKFEIVQKRLCSALPDAYYAEVSDKVVFDKCRSWTLPDNMDMIADYITEHPKVLVLVRPIADIISSFVELNTKNGVETKDFSGFLQDWSEPIMRSYNGVMAAKQMNEGEFLFIDYDAMVSDMPTTLDRIYAFTGMKAYTHDLDSIAVLDPEDDSVYGLNGMHEVRSHIGKRRVHVDLPTEILDKCAALTDAMYDNMQLGN